MLNYILKSHILQMLSVSVKQLKQIYDGPAYVQDRLQYLKIVSTQEMY